MQNLKTSTLIAQGLKYLWDGRNINESLNDEKEEYLCHAIHRAARGGYAGWSCYTHRETPEVESRVKEVRAMIEKRLFPWNTLEAWLRHCANVPVGKLTHERLQQHRRKWALKMIAEFKRKGD